MKHPIELQSLNIDFIERQHIQWLSQIVYHSGLSTKLDIS